MSSGSVNAHSRVLANILRDGAVEFRDVSFGYKARLSVLKGMSRHAAYYCGNQSNTMLSTCMLLGYRSSQAGDAYHVGPLRL
jgi:hypothetical protein